MCALHGPRFVGDAASPEAGSARHCSTAQYWPGLIVQAIPLNKESGLLSHLSLCLWCTARFPLHLQPSGTAAASTHELGRAALSATFRNTGKTVGQVKEHRRAQRWQEPRTVQREKVYARRTTADWLDICAPANKSREHVRANRHSWQQDARRCKHTQQAQPHRF